MCASNVCSNCGTEIEVDEDDLSLQTFKIFYAKLAIQPMEYALANKLNYAQANVLKYVTRYKDKNGIEDLKKAIHCIELLIEFEEKSNG